MKAVWMRQTVGLRFALGDFVLFRPSFPFMVLDAHFTEMGPDSDESLPPWAELDPSVEGLMVVSRPISERLPRRSSVQGAIRYVPRQYSHYYINLTCSFEDYLKKFPSKARYNLKREVRKFAEHCGGQIRWRLYRTADEVGEFYRLAREVSKRTYQERLLQVGLPDTETYRSELLGEATLDKVRAYLLFHNGEPVAYLLCRARQDVLLYDYLGYDPAYRELAPGSVLQYHALENLFGEHAFRMLDLGTGEGHHKRFYATHSVRCADFYYFRRTWRNHVLLTLHAASESLTTAVGQVLSAIRLKPLVKRLIRRTF